MDNQLNNTGSDVPVLLSAGDFAKKHKWKIGGLRHLLFFKPDGFEAAIRRVGRKVLIHEGEFFAWVERINHPVQRQTSRKPGETKQKDRS